MSGLDLKGRITVIESMIVIFCLYAVINQHFGFIKTTDYIFTSNTFLYYTTWAGILAAVCSVITLYYVRKDMELPKMLMALKLAFVSMMTMCLLAVSIILVPTKGIFLLLDPGGMLFIHLIVPFMAVYDYFILVGRDVLGKKDVVISMIPTLIYLVTVYSVLLILGSDALAPYEFMAIFSQPAYMTVLWTAGFLAFGFLTSIVYWKLNGRIDVIKWAP